MAPIVVGGRVDSGRDAPTRWGVMLVWFMRVTALLWIALGLFYWTLILEPGAVGAQASPFMAASHARQAAIVFFATLDLVAAVGLWLIAPWGGVVWLFTALAEIVVAGVLPQLGVAHGAALTVDSALVAVFFGLNIMAAREQDA